MCPVVCSVLHTSNNPFVVLAAVRDTALKQLSLDILVNWVPSCFNGVTMTEIHPHCSTLHKSATAMDSSQTQHVPFPAPPCHSLALYEVIQAWYSENKDNL